MASKFYIDYLSDMDKKFRPAINFLVSNLRECQEVMKASEFLKNPFVFIESREKSFDSAVQKFKNKNNCTPSSINELEETIRDIAGIRIVCQHIDDIDDIQNIVQNIHGVQVLDNFTKDYVKNPKPSGYSGLHLTVAVTLQQENPVLVEIQVRTMLMHVWSSLEHCLRYKNEKPNKKTVWLLVALAKLFRQIDEMLPTLRERGNNLNQEEVLEMFSKIGQIKIDEL